MVAAPVVVQVSRGAAAGCVGAASLPPGPPQGSRAWPLGPPYEALRHLLQYGKKIYRHLWNTWTDAWASPCR